jgi:tetraacyldisaccharide 4'-kinase
VPPRLEAWFVSQWQVRGLAWRVFAPLAWVFGALGAARRFAYRFGVCRTRDAGRPLIVVGNLTVGGTGKTPLVMHLAGVLRDHGVQVGIVTRGHRRIARSAPRQPIHVPTAASDQDALDAGDEPVLLARTTGVPVVAHPDRVAAARALLERHPHIDVIISDDGLQHLAMRRDLEICVVDGRRGFGNGALLPAGPLREPVARARAVDAIVVHRAATGPMAIEGLDAAAVPVFGMRYGKESLWRVQEPAQAGRLAVDAARAQLHGRRVAAMAGIGDPARFFAHLERLGFVLDECIPMPDHHEYTGAQLRAIAADAILVTEKDAVKLARFKDERVWALAIEAELDDSFDRFVRAAIDRLLNRHVA